MHGSIDVQSEYKKGSVFKITLPQKLPLLEKAPVANAEAVPKTEEEKQADNSKKTILIVDDNALNIKVAERTLQAMGYNTKSANSGHDAINKVKIDNSFDLILMDIMMPEMDGVECLKKLRKIPDFNIKVVALTADAVAGAKEKYLREGFNDYVSKPFNKMDIDRVMKDVG